MNFVDNFKHTLLNTNEENFADSSLAAFEYQYAECDIYHSYCNYLGKTPKQCNTLEDIPFLPIEFFKNHAIKSGRWDESHIFKSSGTTDTGKSRHFIRDLPHYHSSAKATFERIVCPLASYKIVAILPSYQEQGNSSLISMVDYFIRNAAPGSGFFLEEDCDDLLADPDKKLIIGVSYALLDISERSPLTNNAIIMETGGMKGRRKEMTRDELHNSLKKGFGVDTIWSEYGMTELQSQAYGRKGQFEFPSWARCLIRDINDPFGYLEYGKTGGINVIDLANIDTCCFIETKDLGRAHENIFQVLGRFDNSDIRGCNLMI